MTSRRPARLFPLIIPQIFPGPSQIKDEEFWEAKIEAIEEYSLSVDEFSRGESNCRAKIQLYLIGQSFLRIRFIIELYFLVNEYISNF